MGVDSDVSALATFPSSSSFSSSFLGSSVFSSFSASSSVGFAIFPSSFASGKGLGEAVEFAVSFLSVLCEAVRSFLSSGVVGVEEANSEEAEWNVASDAVDAEGGCG